MTKEEILKEKGITELTAFHAYPYLYRATIEAMDLYAQQQTEELRKENEELKDEIVKRNWGIIESGAKELTITRLRELLERAKDWIYDNASEESSANDEREKLLADLEKELNPKP